MGGYALDRSPVRYSAGVSQVRIRDVYINGTVMLITRLRLATGPEHESLEQSLPLLDANLTTETYSGVIQALEAFVKRWETIGGTLCPPSLRPAFEARRRSVLLVRDLECLGKQPMDRAPSLPFLDSPAAFFGAMYVMEGSTLGGQLISRHLEKVLGFREGRCYSFFLGHGQKTGRLWKEFCGLLEEQGAELDSEAVIAGAKQMFVALHRWIESTRTVNV